jgi:hypothetical protein
MSSALALMSVPQAIQLFQVAAREVIPYPEMLSWLGYYRSQEAVIEAVGGG